MVRQIPVEIGEKLMEQAQQTGQQMVQAPKTIFQRMVGERTDEEKKQSRDEGKSGIEPLTGGSGQQGQPPTNQTDLRRQEILAEKEAWRKKMQNILHKKLAEEAQRIRQKNTEEARLRQAKEDEERRKKQEKQEEEWKEEKKKQDLAVVNAQREQGAGEFGPKNPK